jgi:hypothetical protein
MNHEEKTIKKYSVLVIALVVGAYFIASMILPAPNMIKLDTIVYHVCENKKIGDVIIHIPNVTAVYQQILTANANKYPNILLFPTYAGSWEDELAWLTNNFGGVNGIPIMLEVFCSGTPVFQLTIDQILVATEVCNVKWLRFAEVISVCHDYNLTFPTDYVSAILNFCKSHNLKLFWTEYSVDNVFQRIKSYIAGFEDIVTVSFSTNSGELEPADGFALVKSLFLHWGGSVQSWYWETRHRSKTGEGPIKEEESRNMPISWMIDHAQLCRNMGAEVIQFEPYWYFFGDTDGKTRESLKLMHYYLNSK